MTGTKNDKSHQYYPRGLTFLPSFFKASTRLAELLEPAESETECALVLLCWGRGVRVRSVGGLLLDFLLVLGLSVFGGCFLDTLDVTMGFGGLQSTLAGLRVVIKPRGDL